MTFGKRLLHHGKYGMINEFWFGKRVFLTGHTGFKGGWLTAWLASMGADVTGFSLNNIPQPSFYSQASVPEFCFKEFFGDICQIDKLKEAVEQCDPQVIFHLAAQPIVKDSYDEPIRNFDVNLMGLVNVLECARLCSELQAIVVVTSDKCYLNDGKNISFSEDYPLGGNDPYSASKACAEIITASYRSSFFKNSSVGIASARAGNVIGGGDFNTTRLLPDYFLSASNNYSLKIRNKDATRPWQHVLEPLSGYLKIAEATACDPKKYSRPWNLGPVMDESFTVEKILGLLRQYYKDIDVEYVAQNFNEAQKLSIDSTAIRTILNWKPKWTTQEAVLKTCDWMHAYDSGSDMKSFSISQLEQYIDDHERSD